MQRTLPALALIAAALAWPAAGRSAAAQAPRTRTQAAPTRLVPAETTGVATARGTIQGRAFRDFAIRAGAGQTLAVELQAGSASAYFNVLPPGSNDVAMFIGSTSGGRFQGVAPIAGDYLVRVYLVRSAARRNEASTFTLTAHAAGTALVPLPAAEDAVIPGTRFHARATVPCAIPYEADVHECEASVVRYGHDGTATVELRSPRGFVRRILFVKGTPTASDATELPTSTRRGDTTTVRIGADEHYEVPDALLSGG
jgi:hypothetical protein